MFRRVSLGSFENSIASACRFISSQSIGVAAGTAIAEAAAKLLHSRKRERKRESERELNLINPLSINLSWIDNIIKSAQHEIDGWSRNRPIGPNRALSIN